MSRTLAPDGSALRPASDIPLDGLALRAARNWLGLGVQALAEHLGVDVRQLRTWETSTALVPVEISTRIRGLQNVAMMAMTGAELRLAREALGLTTESFAEMFMVDQRNLRRWELDVVRVPEGLATDVRRFQAEVDSEVAALVDAAAGHNRAILLTYPSDEDYRRCDPAGDRWPSAVQRRIVARVCEQVPGARAVYAPASSPTVER